LASWRSMMKIDGTGSESGSISQRHGSADPVPRIRIRIDTKYHGFASLRKTVNSIDQKIRVFCPINVQELHLRIDCGFLKSTSRNDCEQHWAKHSSLLWNCCPSFWFSTLVYWGSGFGSEWTPKYHGFASLRKTVNSIDQKIRVFCSINVQELHLRNQNSLRFFWNPPVERTVNSIEQNTRVLLWNCCPSF